MTTVVLVGGNGYIGSEVTRQWLTRDSEARFIVTSRSDRRAVDDARIEHVQVDVNDAVAFEKALPSSADYVVNLTYGSNDALENIRKYAEGHGVQGIGNVGCIVSAPGFEDFVAMKNAELEFLREGEVPVANYDLTIAYGEGRDDDLARMVAAGALNEQNPVHVGVVARLLIDRLTLDWLG